MAPTTTLIAQLRALFDLTNTEILLAETRLAQARTDAVRRELTRNAANAADRARAIEDAIAELGGLPEVIGPFLGRAAAAVKVLTEQAQPFDEALLGDLALEGQLLDRARYLKALSVAAQRPEITALAERLITAHAATVDWLTTVLAEDALGGPAALRRTPAQAVVGAAVRAVNAPVQWSVRGMDRALQAARNTRPAVEERIARAADAGEVAAKAMSAARDAALHTAERVARREGATGAADALHAVRSSVGVLDAEELPVPGYPDLTVNDAAQAVKTLEAPGDIRAIIAYEEAHKNRARVVSAAQTRLAAIAQEIVGIG